MTIPALIPNSPSGATTTNPENFPSASAPPETASAQGGFTLGTGLPGIGVTQLTQGKGCPVLNALSNLVKPNINHELNQISTDLNPIGKNPDHQEWSQLYTTSDDYFKGSVPEFDYVNKLKTMGVHTTQDTLKTDRKVIMFQPVALAGNPNGQLSLADKQKLIFTILEELANSGVPLDKFDVVIRTEDFPFNDSDVGKDNEISTTPLKGGVQRDQDDKLALNGPYSKKVCYSYEIIPSTQGRSRATGINADHAEEILKNPAELVKYINYPTLIKNLSELTAKKQWDKPKKVAAALMNSLWDGKHVGWSYFLKSILHMEGFVSQLFVEYKDDGVTIDYAKTARVARHEGPTLHFLGLVDAYGRGEYTEWLRKERPELWKLFQELTGEMPKSEALDIVKFMVVSGTTPDIFEFLNDASLQKILNLAVGDLSTAVDEKISDGLGKTSLQFAIDKLIKPNIQRIDNTHKFELGTFLNSKIVRTVSQFPIKNVAFSQQELEDNFMKYVAPYIYNWQELLADLVAKPGGMLESKGTWHYEYVLRDGSGNIILGKSLLCNDRNSSDATVKIDGEHYDIPISPFAGAEYARQFYKQKLWYVAETHSFSLEKPKTKATTQAKSNSEPN